MREARSNNPRAVDIAESLSAQNGESALGIALGRRHAAVASGKIARADLYLAVCAILTNRDQVFSRWKAGA